MSKTLWALIKSSGKSMAIRVLEQQPMRVAFNWWNAWSGAASWAKRKQHRRRKQARRSVEEIISKQALLLCSPIHMAAVLFQLNEIGHEPIERQG